jgi:hypothetical protein
MHHKLEYTRGKCNSKTETERRNVKCKNVINKKKKKKGKKRGNKRTERKKL